MECSFFGLIKTAAICLIILQTECTEFQNVENSSQRYQFPLKNQKTKGEKLRYMKLEVKQTKIK